MLDSWRLSYCQSWLLLRFMFVLEVCFSESRKEDVYKLSLNLILKQYEVVLWNGTV